MKTLTLAIALVITLVGSAPAQSIRITVIDVGQGDALLVRTPNGPVRPGRPGQDPWLADSLVSQFGVTRLELAIGSHRHYDHVGGMDEVLRRIPTTRLIWDSLHVANRAFDDSVRSAARQESVPIERPPADTVMVDGVRFIILPVQPRVAFSDENNNSIVVRLEYGEFSFLFTGDIEEEGRDWLVANFPVLLDVGVLKASHHGSHNGTSASWLQAVTPERVVISAGVRADYGHPYAAAVDAYVTAANGRVYCTNRVSTIRVYGWEDGRIRVTVKLPENQPKSCVFDGTITFDQVRRKVQEEAEGDLRNRIGRTPRDLRRDLFTEEELREARRRRPVPSR